MLLDRLLSHIPQLLIFLDTQKLIKYVAIGFAFILIFGIISSILFGLNSLFGIIDNNKDGIKNMEVVNISDSVNVLDIEVDKVNLKIKTGDTLRVELDRDSRISYNDNGNRLVIKENKLNLFADVEDVIIYVPSSMEWEKVLIETGAGMLDVEELVTDKLELELGVGSVLFNNLNVSKTASIDTGVGKFILSRSVINNLELDMGLGDVILEAKVLGKSEVNAGVGKLDLDLVGESGDYTIDIDEGIGSVLGDGKKLIEKGPYGSGNNYIEIDGGIGECNINFVD